RWADAISKRAQNYDRQEAIDALTKIASAESAAALLKRFTFQVDPSITDQEEKESAFRGVVHAGAAALPAIRDSFARAESVQWQLRAMREILNDEVFIDEVSALLAKWDTEYARDPDPKTQMIAALEALVDPRVRQATERFLEDVNEPTRFQAVSTLLAQDDAELAGPLARALGREEAMRTKNRIAEGLAARGWSVPAEDRDALSHALPRYFSLDERGVVHKG
ncbi:MAG: HEAT repeat domain-containing protein, partial [Polyangiales bacterium]